MLAFDIQASKAATLQQLAYIVQQSSQYDGVEFLFVFYWLPPEESLKR